MPVQYVNMDITTVERGVVAHGVNCSGAMNSGVAKSIRNRWPVVYERFMKYPKGEKVLGEVDFIYIPNEDVVVANCYTQIFYGYGGGKYADATAIQKTLRKVFQIADLQSYPAYIPKIGCGLGGLSYETDVRPIVESLGDTYKRLHIYVCELEK